MPSGQTLGRYPRNTLIGDTTMMIGMLDASTKRQRNRKMLLIRPCRLATRFFGSVFVALLLATNDVARHETATTSTPRCLSAVGVVDAFSFNLNRQQKQQQQQMDFLGHNPRKLPTNIDTYAVHNAWRGLSSSSTKLKLSSASTPDASATLTSAKPSKALHPKVGDVVRYYDLDGGEQMGEILVGRISFIFGSSTSGWNVELTELEPIGDGYYAEYSSTKRSRKKTERSLARISPIMASYVQSEQAWKVPLNRQDNTIIVRQENYDIETYLGPTKASVDPNVLQTDAERYAELKVRLLKQTLLAGLVGVVGVDLWKGPEDAAIYAAGSLGSLLYLLFLSFKTDTIATGNDTGNSAAQRLGSPLSNLRFFMPVLVLIGVSLYNAGRGDLNPLKDTSNVFETVTKEQFAVAIIGFLTYRIPLFVNQIRDAFKEMSDEDNGGLTLPGSAGVALQVLKDQQQQLTPSASAGTDASSLTTILLVSGPQATGRSDLVSKLVEQDERLVEPFWTRRLDDGATFERLEQRDEFLILNAAKSAGLTKEGVLTAATKASTSADRVVVVDADIELAKKLQRLSGAKLIGVWVGLESVADFEKRLSADIDSGKISIPPDETRESVIRARIKEIITEIEYGLSSGIFEFTILNKDDAESLRELKQAAEYCFK